MTNLEYLQKFVNKEIYEFDDAYCTLVAFPEGEAFALEYCKDLSEVLNTKVNLVGWIGPFEYMIEVKK